MKNFFIAILLLILIYPAVAQTVKVGFFQGYPTNFIDEKTGIVTGHTVEYIKDFLNEIGYEVEFVGPLPFPRLLSMLKSGDIDSLLGMSWIKEREEYVFYPNKPYRITIPSIFVLNESNIVNGMDLLKLAEFTFSYRNGAVLPESLREFESILEIESLSRDTWIDQSLQMLELGRIDGIINSSDLSIIAAAKRLGLHKRIRKVTLPGKRDPIYLGISKKSEIGPKLIKKYNKNILSTKLFIEDYDNLEF